VKPLKIEPKLSQIAQKVADSVAKATVLKHTNKTFMGKTLGENMASFTKTKTSVSGLKSNDY
jgi:uncharacterized protein YkwD